MPFKSCLGPKQLQIYLNIQTRLPQLTNAMLQMVYMLYKLTIYFNNHNNNRQQMDISPNWPTFLPYEKYTFFKDFLLCLSSLGP